jgi:hypothetical protein
MSEPGVGTCEDAQGTSSSVLPSGSSEDAQGTSSLHVVDCSDVDVDCSDVDVIWVWLEVIGKSFGACITAIRAIASHVEHAGSTVGGGAGGGRLVGSCCGGGGSGGGRG